MFQWLRGMVASLLRPRLPSVSVDALAPFQNVWDNGDKWEGSFGPTQLLSADYWTLRARSSQLFETNLYARGLIRRLTTNVINTGLHLEATPGESLLNLPKDALVEWSENTENRFALWGSDATLCAQDELETFGDLQSSAYREALVAGDVLVTLGQDRRTGLPRVSLVRGSAVRSPMQQPVAGNRIVHGVELDSAKRHVAYWVTQSDGSSKRVPAWGEKSGRRIAWLVYGTDHRLDDVRGKPMLALVLQSLREIDRYRDSVQRKATINAMIAAFIKKTQDKPGTRPLTGGAIRKGRDPVVDTTGVERRYKIAEQIPGLVIEELQQGEEPHGFHNQGTDEKFGDFESAILRTIAWAHEIPPEILELSFGSNYSASQAAINEFKLYLNRERTRFGNVFCQPIYVDWLLSQVLSHEIDAAKFLEAWRNPKMYAVLGAWTSAAWAGHIKPAVDMTKLVTAYGKMCELGFISRDRAARELTGTKYSQNVQKLRIENSLLAEANKPLAELEAAAKTAPSQPPPSDDPVDDNAEDDADDDESKDKDTKEDASADVTPIAAGRRAA